MSKNIKFFETGWSLDLFKEQNKALPFACVVYVFIYLIKLYDVF